MKISDGNYTCKEIAETEVVEKTPSGSEIEENQSHSESDGSNRRGHEENHHWRGAYDSAGTVIRAFWTDETHRTFFWDPPIHLRQKSG